jgi:hypothetical protein
VNIEADCWKLLNALERKILKKIYGRTLVKGQWRNGNYGEICKLFSNGAYREYQIERATAGGSCDRNDLRGLERVGHVIGMRDEWMPKESLNGWIHSREKGEDQLEVPEGDG